MRGMEFLDCLEYVDAGLIEGADAPPRRRSHWKRWTALAACLCLALALAAVYLYQAPAGEAESRVTVSEDGVTIRPPAVNLESHTSAAMIAFFIYDGRCYEEYEWHCENADFVGDYLGTATGLIDEWTPKDGYVELAGSVEGDFYSVQGFDPDFMLCMPQADGTVSTFLCGSGITLKTGADLFEDRLHLSESCTGVEYQTRSAWYYSTGERHVLGPEYEDAVEAFLSALDSGLFLPEADIPLPDDETNIYDALEIYHLFFSLNNGMTVHLRVFEGGYVRFAGIRDVCVQLEKERFDAFIDLLDAGAGAPD